MTLKQPISIDECVYFTNRTVGNGKLKAWVPKEICPKCKKGIMSKPLDPKTGKPQIRAKEYACKECNFTMPEEEYEDTLTINVQYTCPYCNFQGEKQVPFIRKKIQVFDEETQKKKTIEAVRFQCGKCGKNIDITKKMK